MSSSDSGATPAPEPNRSPARRSAAVSTPRQAKPKRFIGLTLFLVMIAFATGTALGALVMRQRAKGKEVVASINGTVILRDQLYRRLEIAAGARIMRQIADEELALQFAHQQGVSPTNAQIETRYQELSQVPGFQESLAQSGQTTDEVKRGIRVALCQSAQVSKGVTVSPAEIQKFYQQNCDGKNPQARYYTPDKIQIAIIVTKTQAIATKAFTELNSGVSFATVAAKYSEDVSKTKGGLLPPMFKGRTPASKKIGVEQAIFGMKVGQQLSPRNFGTLWWVIRCVDKSPAVTLPFEKVKEDCRIGAMLAKGIPTNSQSVAKSFAQFRKKAAVQAFWTQYEQALKME